MHEIFVLMSFASLDGVTQLFTHAALVLYAWSVKGENQCLVYCRNCWQCHVVPFRKGSHSSCGDEIFGKSLVKGSASRPDPETFQCRPDRTLPKIQIAHSARVRKATGHSSSRMVGYFSVFYASSSHAALGAC